MECTGYWETCNCPDCKRAAELYELLDYYEYDSEFQFEIDEAIKELENMGYYSP